MSADDGIYIIKLKSMVEGHEYAYRMCHLFAIHDVLKYTDRVYAAFCESDVTHDYNEILKKAYKLDKDIRSEFGVLIISQYHKHTWSDLVNKVAYENRRVVH